MHVSAAKQKEMQVGRGTVWSCKVINVLSDKGYNVSNNWRTDEWMDWQMEEQTE